MTLTVSDFNDYLYERWVKPDGIMTALLVNSPVLGMIPKDESGFGRYVHVPILQTGPQGRSATYATAKTNATGSTPLAFDVTAVSNYQIAKLTGDVVNDAKGDPNSLFEALDHEIEGAMANMKKDLRLQVFGNLGGSRGQVGSVSTVYLTLLNYQDAIHFEVGQEICAASTDGTSGSLRDSGQAITLVGVNRSSGILTADENWSEIASIAANDHLFAEGDFGAKMSGILGWLPATAPSASESYFGIDRSNEPERLAGIRYTATGMPVEEAFMNACAVGQLLDTVAKIGVVNPIKWAEIAISLGADRGNRVVKMQDTTGRIGYEAIMVATPMGDVPIVGDPGCQVRYGLLLDMNTWELRTAGPMVHIINDDGLTIRRDTTDGWIVELKSRGNLLCKDPSKNIRMDFGA